jgi:NitT/TauT family transport system permease protein
LPIYALTSLSRLIVTYLICLVFGLAVGITAAMNDKVGDIVIPLLDILQSIPVLAVFPFAILFIVPVMGMTTASIVALFMSMAWSIVFGVIAGVKAIPPQMHDMARLFNLRGFAFVKHIVLPSIYPPLIAGSMLAFGSGWYFIIASEFITYGATTKTSPGLGYYLNVASFQYASLWMSLAGFLSIALLVYTIHVFFWKRLDHHAREAKFLNLHFGYENTEKHPDTTHRPHAHHHAHRVHFNRRHAHQWFFNIFHYHPGIYVIILSSILVGLFLLNWLTGDIVIFGPQEMLAFLIGSVSRIILAYLIAASIAILLGYLLIRKPRTRNFLIPLADVMQSIPAIAYFPTLYLVLTWLLPEWIGLQVASVALLMTGMLWYLLFNVVEAVQFLPRDIEAVADLYDIEGLAYIKEVLVPAMFPALVTGSILAFGGGWNAIIVSEYVTLGGEIHKVPGLGTALNEATRAGSTPTLIMGLCIMTGFVLLLNHFLWRRLLNKASKYVLEEE